LVWPLLAANLIHNLPAVRVPTLVVGAMADQDIFVADTHAQLVSKRLKAVTM
jgi:hypothetical protein